MPQATKRWRLKKTLSRTADFHPIERDDLKFVWAAHRKGALDTVDDHFAAEDLEPEEFERDFTAIVTTKYHGVWVLTANDKPIGMALAFVAHPDERLAPFWILDQTIWFPWSTPRTRVEALIKFLNETRKEMLMLGFAREKDKKFFEVAAKHGIVRRIGKTHEVFPDEKFGASIFETRSP